MNPDVVVSVRHYGTQRDGHVARSASSSSRDRVIALSLIAGMVVAAVCCVVFLSPVHSASLESDQDSIDDLLNKIDKLTASTSPTARRSAALAPHIVQEHVRLNVETPEQKFLDEVNGIAKAEASHNTDEPVLQIPRAVQPHSSGLRSRQADVKQSPDNIIKILHKEDAASDPDKLGIPSDPSNLSPAQKAKVKAELAKVADALKNDFKSDIDFANKAGYLPPIPGHPGV